MDRSRRLPAGGLFTARRLAATIAGTAALGAAGLVAGVAGAAAAAPAIIDNGTVQLGVQPHGDLNVPGGTASSGVGTTIVGLRYMPTNADATAPGCACEGWGAADATSGVSGYADESTDGGPQNITPVSFVADANSAVSVVDIASAPDAAPTLRVTQDYHPSPATPDLYEDTVTIENTSTAPVDARYRRVMDWDIEPTAFAEYVTVNTGNSSALLDSDDNGFGTANPLGADGPALCLSAATADFVDEGPCDHGARFDFGFGTLDPGAKKTFKIYYGAAGSETEALDALGAVGAEVYSLGEPSTPDGPTLGTPNTFMFAFTGVGGTSVVPPPPVATHNYRLVLAPPTASNPVDTPDSVTATLTDNGKPVGAAKILFSVAGPNAQPDATKATDASGHAALGYTGRAAGDDTITACYDADGSGTCDAGEQTATASKHWTLHDASIAYTGGTTVQYSDPVTLTGHLVDATSGAGVAGRTLDFVLGTQTASAGPTDANGDASATVKVTQEPGTVPSVNVAFAGDGSFPSVSDSQPVSVTPEDCTLSYSGGTKGVAGADTALAADLGEPDTSLGDRSAKTVTFTVTGGAGTARTFTATTDAKGHAATNAPLAAGTYDVSVSFTGDTFYNACSTGAGTTVTVQAPPAPTPPAPTPDPTATSTPPPPPPDQSAPTPPGTPTPPATPTPTPPATPKPTPPATPAPTPPHTGEDTHGNKDKPHGRDDFLEVTRKPAKISPLANDAVKDKHGLKLVKVSKPAFGKVTFTARTCTYTPGKKYRDHDSFRYWARDGSGHLYSGRVVVAAKARKK